MAGTRERRDGKPVKGGSRDHRELRADKLIEAGVVTGSHTEAKPIVTARSVVEVAKANLAGTGVGRKDPVGRHVLRILGAWGSPQAPQAAAQFWAQESNAAAFGFYRSYPPLGSSIVAHAAVVDLASLWHLPSADNLPLPNAPSHPDQVGGAFDPRRQKACTVASTLLLDAAGSTDLVHALEQPIPDHLSITTYNRWHERQSTKPFPDRLEDYEESLRMYERSLPLNVSVT